MQNANISNIYMTPCALEGRLTTLPIRMRLYECDALLCLYRISISLTGNKKDKKELIVLHSRVNTGPPSDLLSLCSSKRHTSAFLIICDLRVAAGTVAVAVRTGPRLRCLIKPGLPPSLCLGLFVTLLMWTFQSAEVFNL